MSSRRSPCPPATVRVRALGRDRELGEQRLAGARDRQNDDITTPIRTQNSMEMATAENAVTPTISRRNASSAGESEPGPVDHLPRGDDQDTGERRAWNLSSIGGKRHMMSATAAAEMMPYHCELPPPAG